MDPRDGTAPPPLPDQSPANPLAVAQLLSGNPNLTVAQIPQVLGAAVADLIRDKSSILYGGRALKAEAKRTKASGAPAADGKVVAVLAPYIQPAVAKGSVATKPAKVTEPPSNRDAAALAWVLAQLARFGVTCERWTAMSDEARLVSVGNIHYNSIDLAREQQVLAAGLAPTRPDLPSDPRVVVEAVNVACGLPRTARPARPSEIQTIVGSAQSQAVPRDVSAEWWRRARAAGVTCDQWYAATEWQRYRMIQSLAAQRIIDRGQWSDGQMMWAINGECQRSVEPAVSDPTAPIRARLRAILDCENLDAQDKLQQVATIQRAFPELNREPMALYRLCLARYDLCHPASEQGWSGAELVGLSSGRIIRENVQNGYRDVLDGDVTGISTVQWVKQGQYMPSTGPDLFDPIQGNVGDCYLIAAMASLAWTRPDFIASIGQSVGPDRRRFRFNAATVDVSDRVPCAILRAFIPIFARGNRIDAQWPGVLEKAYAAYRANDAGDRPNVLLTDNQVDGAGQRLSGGRGGALPLVDVTGGNLFWHQNHFRSDDGVLETIVAHCDPSGRARSPMVATTYETGFVERTGLSLIHI